MPDELTDVEKLRQHREAQAAALDADAPRREGLRRVARELAAVVLGDRTEPVGPGETREAVPMPVRPKPPGGRLT